jgi:hypothetical protein
MNTTQTSNPQFQIALNGLVKISSGPDHVWAVYSAWGALVFFRADLTRAQAEELARQMNAAA